MTEQSKFVLTFDRSANEVNRRPNLKGSYRLAGEDHGGTLSFWGGESKTGKLYARGQASPEGVSEALRASKGQATDIATPANIEIKVGEAVLFENEKSTKENRQPKFYGYVREPERYVRLAGWERGNTITGSAEPYRPAAENEELDPPSPEMA